LNLKEKDKLIRLSFSIRNPEVFHWSKINLIIKSELLLLLTKKGSDKFKVAFEKDFEVANNGINK